VVVISFSIIVSCIFISLLLVTVGIVYSKMGSNIDNCTSIQLIFNLLIAYECHQFFCEFVNIIQD